MKKVILSLTVLGAVSLFAANTAACAGCHGANFEKKALGKSKIVKDMSPADIEKALKGFKEASYNGPMKGFAAALKDADIKEIAEKFGKK